MKKKIKKVSLDNQKATQDKTTCRNLIPRKISQDFAVPTSHRVKGRESKKKKKKKVLRLCKRVAKKKKSNMTVILILVSVL